MRSMQECNLTRDLAVFVRLSYDRQEIISRIIDNNYTSEMQSIGQAKHMVLMVTRSDLMATYHFADCVHWHKIKINVSL